MPQLPLVRSEIWFSDGNIILIAGQYGFKVHRGQLQRHSEVFRDMFMLPPPPLNEEEVIEGCSYVEMHDSADDVFYFLSALYDGLYTSLNDFPRISAVLRLSSKYLVPHLRHLTLSRLISEFPSTLQSWDAREHSATDPETGHYRPRDIYPHPILVIHLAFELGIHEILPAAFYDLARYGPSRVMSGTTTASSEDDDERAVVVLTRGQLHQTLRGRECVQRYMARFIAESLQNRAPSPSCLFMRLRSLHRKPAPAPAAASNPSHNPCTDSINFITFNILRSIGGIAYGRDADTLYTLLQAFDILERTEIACPAPSASWGSGFVSGAWFYSDSYPPGGYENEAGTGITSHPHSHAHTYNTEPSNNQQPTNSEDPTTTTATTATNTQLVYPDLYPPSPPPQQQQQQQQQQLRMCAPCKHDLGLSIRRAREEVWEALPVWFGLVGGGGGGEGEGVEGEGVEGEGEGERGGEGKA